MEMMHSIPRLEPRASDSHKGTYGRLLIIGGSIGLSGAPALAGKAALRSGAGLVRLAVPRSVLPIVASLDPCYTTLPLPEDDQGQIDSTAVRVLEPYLDQADVICFGPGAGTGPGVGEVLMYLLSRGGLKLVIDADGLNVLCRMPEWLQRKKAEIVLTPHPGEMKRLWKSLFRRPLPEQRQQQAGEFAELTGGVVVLKGAGTIVTDASYMYINQTGNPGMATAGAGDVLTGMIGALTGQGLSLLDASISAVYLHGLAGDIAAEQKGQISLTATDIMERLAEAFKKYSAI